MFNIFIRKQESLQDAIPENLSIAQIRENIEAAIKHLPEEVGDKIKSGELRGMCGTIIANIMRQLDPNMPIRAGVSSDKNWNGHKYLVATCEGKEYIIDPSIGQFVQGFEGTFFGTRNELRDLILSPNTILINTSSSNDSSQAFQRIWGNSSVYNV